MTWTPAPTSTPTATPTLAPGEIKVVKLPEPYGLSMVYWSEDGQSVFSLREDWGGPRYEPPEVQWYRYDLTTNASQSMGPAYLLDSLPWEQLEALNPGKISPSGEHLIYIRLSPEQAAHPTPHGPFPYQPFFEVWTARSDGTDARRLYGPDSDCGNLVAVQWFAQETEVVFECSFESSSMIARIQMSNNPVIEYNFSPDVLYYSVAVSPDQTKMAFTGGGGTVQVCSGSNCQKQPTGRGFRPNWSADGRSLYYLKGDPDEFSSFVGVYKLDLDTRADMPLFLLSDYFPDAEESLVGQFAVSPLDNVAVLEFDDSLWLLTWSP